MTGCELDSGSFTKLNLWNVTNLSFFVAGWIMWSFFWIFELNFEFAFVASLFVAGSAYSMVKYNGVLLRMLIRGKE